MIKWSRVRLILSILSCEGLFTTLRERVQFAPASPPYRTSETHGQHPGSLSMPRYYDYSGALHVHSTYSDGAGTVPEIAKAANEAGLDFVLLCDHSSLQARQDSQDGWRGRTLILVGTEVTTDTGHLLALNVPDSFLPAPAHAPETQRAIIESGGIGFIALPCDLKDHWRDFSAREEKIGLEVFNLSAIARTKINLPALAMIWQRYKGSRPNRAFHLVAARPDRELRLWDHLMAPDSPDLPARQIPGIASLDAHAVMRFGGREYPIPTYAEVFRTLRTHVVTTKPLSYGDVSAKRRAAATEEDTALIHQALGVGHCYMAYDNYGDPTGFVFEAEPLQNPEALVVMGDAVTVSFSEAPEMTLVVRAPRTRTLVRLYRNGRQVAAARGGFLEYRATQTGVYRAEVYLYRYRLGRLCLGVKPWIFSNPIYLQPVSVPQVSSTQPVKKNQTAPLPRS